MVGFRTEHNVIARHLQLFDFSMVCANEIIGDCAQSRIMIINRHLSTPLLLFQA